MNKGEVLKFKDLWSCQKHCADNGAAYFSYWDDGKTEKQWEVHWPRWCACKSSNDGAKADEPVIKSGPAIGCTEFLLHLSNDTLKNHYGALDQVPDWMFCGTEKCEGCWDWVWRNKGTGAQKKVGRKYDYHSCANTAWAGRTGLDDEWAKGAEAKEDLRKCPKGYKDMGFNNYGQFSVKYLRQCERE